LKPQTFISDLKS